jgi:sterol 24-C-methyltransferase
MKLTSDRVTRTENYRDLIPEYYDLTTPIYLDGGGSSFHLMPFLDNETIPEAAANMERRLAEEGNFSADMRILDVGCGVGGPAVTIAQHTGAHITGLNISPNQIVAAEARVAERGLSDKIIFVQGDAMQMPFEDNSFDAAYLFESMCYTPDKVEACAEIARVVKPGGTFLGFDWFCSNGITDEQYEQHIEPICRTCAVTYLLTLDELNDCLCKAGFEVKVAEDATSLGNMRRCWDIYETKGRSVARRTNRTLAEDLIIEMIETLVKAARAGFFLMGHWRALSTW